MRGPDLIHDDFRVALDFQRSGVLGGLHHLAFEAPARPGSALHYLAAYEGIGDHPVLQVLLLGLLNAAVAIGVWLVGRELIPPEVAAWAALLFAVAPNRGAARLWVNIGPYLTAMVLVLLAAWLLLVADRVVAGSLLLAAGVLTYEGVALLALLVIGGWCVRHQRSLAHGVAVAIGPATAAALLYLLSPKHDYPSTRPFANAWSVLPAQIGTGFWGSPTLGAIGGVLLITAVLLALAGLLERFLHGDVTTGHQVLGGVAVAAAGAFPFLVAGLVFGTEGIAERHNVVASVGVCVVLAALVAGLQRSVGRWGVAVGAGVVGILLAASWADVERYGESVREGEELVAQLTDRLEPPSDRRVIVVPALPHTDGVAQFIHQADLGLALQYRDDPRWRVSMPSRPEDCRVLTDDDPRDLVIYDRVLDRFYEELPDERCGMLDP